MNTSALLASALTIAQIGIAPGGYHPLPVDAPRRKMPLGFVGYAPMTEDELKQFRPRRRKPAEFVRGLSRKGRLMAQLTAWQ